MAADHERYENDAGAYLLGALPPLEAEVFERHLMGCDECRDEVERLRPAVEALPRSVEAYEPPPSLKRSLMEVVEAEAKQPAPAPRRRRLFAGFQPRPALALAACALLAGVAVGLGLTSGSGDDERVVSASVDQTRLPGGTAKMEITEGGPATLRVTGLPQPPRGEMYEVWVEQDGRVRPAGALFGVENDGSGSAAIPGGVDGVTQVMVTRERAGGAAMPTEPPVIRVEI